MSLVSFTRELEGHLDQKQSFIGWVGYEKAVVIGITQIVLDSGIDVGNLAATKYGEVVYASPQIGGTSFVHQGHVVLFDWLPCRVARILAQNLQKSEGACVNKRKRRTLETG